MKSHFELAVAAEPFLHSLGHLLSFPEELEKVLNAPTRTYVQDTKAMAVTAVDIKESPEAYSFLADMPGLTRSDIEVQVENDNVLSIRGKRKREDNVEEGVKYIRLERKPAKFFRKFTLPSDSNVEKISATCKDGVLIVEVPKLPPPEPEKPKVFEVPVS